MNRRQLAVALCILVPSGGWAGYRVAGVAPLPIGPLAGRGQISDPQWSPDGRAIGFEFRGEDGESQEVYVAEITDGNAMPPKLSTPAAVYRSPPKDPFALPGQAGQSVSGHLAFGPTKGKAQRLAVAASRQAVERGAPQVTFDIYLAEPGRRRFLTSNRANNDHPSFSPDGELLAFSSGLTGHGDIYLYQFYAEGEPLTQLTFEAGGPEIYAAWDAAGERLAYTGHLAGVDHIYVIDDVRRLASEKDPLRRKTMARRQTRDLTPAWKGSCLAPSFSPDGRTLAFYARTSSDAGADLYVVPVSGGQPRRLLEGGLPESRGGPRWSPRGEGLFAVRESAERMNPLVWVPVDPTGPVQEFETGTQLNGDPFPKKIGDHLLLLFTAQGGREEEQKRWRRPFVARLIAERSH